MIEVKIDAIRVSLMSQQHILILRELDSPRYLAIWIGRVEAEAINLFLSGAETPRPLTHELVLRVLGELDAKLARVVINDLYQDTYFAQLEINDRGKMISIDSRSSDAIAIAVRAGVPIFIEESVMDKAGTMPEIEEVTEEKPSENAPDLGAFDDFINSMDLGDLDK
jgi:bifunctional DNase/RNase